jgi:hypothetical protein
MKMTYTDSGTDIDSTLDIPGSLSDTSGSPSSPIDLEVVLDAARRASQNPQVRTADSVNRRRRATG